MKTSDDKFKITYKGKEIELPVYTGTQGPDVVDIARLYKETGLFTYDPGYRSTASCKSDITYIDGNAGILQYRGYPIDQLAKHGNFMETCYLLLQGELPTQAQYDEFKVDIMKHSLLHEQLIKFYSGFRRDAHPMAILVGVFGALSSFYHSDVDIDDPVSRNQSTVRMLAKMPTIAAMAYRYSLGRTFVTPKGDMSYAGNFLRMCFANPMMPYEEDEVLTRAMDRIFILHADHEQNASTSDRKSVV